MKADSQVYQTAPHRAECLHQAHVKLQQAAMWLAEAGDVLRAQVAIAMSRDIQQADKADRS